MSLADCADGGEAGSRGLAEGVEEEGDETKQGRRRLVTDGESRRIRADESATCRADGAVAADRLPMKPVTDVHELFRHQRAIRSFTDQDVPDELVNRVLTAAIHGPSGSNTQPWHFIVIRDPAVKQAISDAYEEARAAAYPGRGPASAGPRQPLSAAPVLIVACVDTPASGQAGFQTGASIYPSV